MSLTCHGDYRKASFSCLLSKREHSPQGEDPWLWEKRGLCHGLSGTPGSANASNARQIDRQSQRIEANRQGEDIDLETFMRSNQQPQQAGRLRAGCRCHVDYG